jgi:hypothetical protein
MGQQFVFQAIERLVIAIKGWTSFTPDAVKAASFELYQGLASGCRDCKGKPPRLPRLPGKEARRHAYRISFQWHDLLQDRIGGNVFPWAIGSSISWEVGSGDRVPST